MFSIGCIINPIRDDASFNVKKQIRKCAGCEGMVDGGRLSGIMSLAFQWNMLRQGWSSVGPLAQLVEQLTLNQWVQGSSPWRITLYLIAKKDQWFSPQGGWFRVRVPGEYI
jgi:hypothetical protein